MKVVWCLNEQLKFNPEAETSSSHMMKDKIIRELESFINKSNIPVGEDGGLVLASPQDREQTNPKLSAEMMKANLAFILNELRAEKILSFGFSANHLLRKVTAELSDIKGISYSNDESFVGTTKFSICQSDFSRNVTIYHCTLPCENYHKSTVQTALQNCYNPAVPADQYDDGILIESVEIMQGYEQEFAPFSVSDDGVSGNGRYLLANGILTHNTPQYLAPEVLVNDAFPARPKQSGYDKSVDLWSLGVILFILVSGVTPFPSQESGGLLDAVKQARFSFNHDNFKTVSAEAKDLISKLIVVDPRQRYNIVQTMNHPWLKDHKFTWTKKVEEAADEDDSKQPGVEFASPNGNKTGSKRKADLISTDSDGKRRNLGDGPSSSPNGNTPSDNQKPKGPQAFS